MLALICNVSVPSVHPYYVPRDLLIDRRPFERPSTTPVSRTVKTTPFLLYSLTFDDNLLSNQPRSEHNPISVSRYRIIDHFILWSNQQTKSARIARKNKLFNKTHDEVSESTELSSTVPTPYCTMDILQALQCTKQVPALIWRQPHRLFSRNWRN